MALHDDRKAITPSSVVSSTNSAEMPSTPKMYWTPMEGIQSSRSSVRSSKPARLVSHWKNSGSEIRKSSPATAVAKYAMPFFASFGKKMSTSAPASGRYAMSESRPWNMSDAPQDRYM